MKTHLDTARIGALATTAGTENVLSRPEDCWAYGYDNSRHHAAPEAVVFATSHEQVARVVRWCHDSSVPLTARGRGTGTTGATVPVAGGIVLSMERMDGILELTPEERIMRVQPGVTNGTVQQRAAELGFFWPPDPTSAEFCTIGGNLAYNSAGPRAIKYGTPRENTLGLLAVTGTGETLHAGVRTTKGVVGLDLTRLIIGSEGTLAIITEATLKLTPLSEAVRTLQAVYSDVGSAARAIARIMGQPAIPMALEFMDGAAIAMIRRFADAPLPEGAGALLMIEVDGSASCVDDSAAAVADAARTAGCLEVRTARTPEQAQALWAARRALSPALRNVAPGKINEDVVVPVSRMPDLIAGLDELSSLHAIPIINFGHAGNGNIHVNLLLDEDNAEQVRAAGRCLEAVFSLVLELGGTLSGEHGVGLVKRDFVARELDACALDLMRRIKAQFDPRSILNPGKMLPSPN